MKHDYSQAVDMYLNKLMSCQMIADHYKVSRVAIHKFLRKNGINTSKRRLIATCHICKKQFPKPRCQIRNSIHQFCSKSCYHLYIHNPEYNQHRQGQRKAREVFESKIGFTFDWIIHHSDGNCDNNNINNLWAFKTQGDHMRYHRGGISQALMGSSSTWQTVQKDP